ncbi:MAG: fumarate hydratase [Candidatus Methanomethylicota archaeon]|uniref:Fumarate hydratase n=1 Tax=Thermoproteota archaeon TaxID=2056631 RepID=A0A497F6W5_9CREN|nr:MAG: fumarate hydratase [Candidatus Verstraetearchaeota archaeon]
MTSDLAGIIERASIMLLKAATTILPPDVKEALIKAKEAEDNPLAKAQLEAILKNCEIAEKEGKPICQDTGLIIFYVKVGENFPIRGKLRDILKSATIKATSEVPLRPNAVDVLTKKNSGDNTGRYIPWIEWEILPDSDILEITAFPKGGGSEAPCAAKVFSPAQGLKYVKKFVVDAVAQAAAKPCPPVLIGLGIGGTIDIAMKLAKKALLRPIGVRSEVPELAKLEEELLELVNSLGIGPHGVGGKTTALTVNVDCAHRHPATFAAGLAFNCWAARRSKMKVYPNGEVEFITHKILNELWR